MPAQTRGFLFSDLRGYSAYTERHGDRGARELLTRYRRIVREAIASCGGAEIRTEGDSFYVVFDSVSQAVQSGLAIQAGLVADTEGEAIRAGIGIHAGEVEDDSEQGIVSSAVNIAARICAAAEPGEVLVSETVHALTRTYLDVTFLQRGRRKLKGIRHPVAVYAALESGLLPARPRWGSRQRGRPLLLAVGLLCVLVVGSLVLATTIFDGPGAVADGQPESRDPAASLAPLTAIASPPLSSVAVDDTDEFPSAREEALLALVEEPYRPLCERAAAGSIPPPIEPADTTWEFGEGDVPFTAGVTCEPVGQTPPDEIALWLLPAGPKGTGSPTAWIVNRAAGRGVASGSCSAEERALEAWAAGPQSGYLLCFSASGGTALIYWTYDGSALLGRAARTDGDLRLLVRWWTDDVRLRRPPG